LINSLREQGITQRNEIGKENETISIRKKGKFFRASCSYVLKNSTFGIVIGALIFLMVKGIPVV
jgi:hypothetical protein